MPSVYCRLRLTSQLFFGTATEMEARTAIVARLSPSNLNARHKDLTAMASPSSVDQTLITPPGSKQLAMHSTGKRKPATRATVEQPRIPKPMMNASDRAKFYRKRIRNHAKQLEQSTKDLKLAAKNLRLLLDIQRHLPLDLSSATRRRVLEGIWEFIDGQRYLNTQNFIHHELCVQSINYRGMTDAPIIQLSTRLQGRYTPETTERLYRLIPGNTRLLGRLMHHDVELPCTIVFYFGSDGELAFETVDMDIVGGLLKAVGDIRDVRALLHGLTEATPLQSSDPCDPVKKESEDENRSHNIAYILG